MEIAIPRTIEEWIERGVAYAAGVRQQMHLDCQMWKGHEFHHLKWRGLLAQCTVRCDSLKCCIVEVRSVER